MKVLLTFQIFAFALVCVAQGQEANFLSKLIFGSNKLKSFRIETAKFTGEIEEALSSNGVIKKELASMPKLRTQKISYPQPPLNPNHARVARYLVHNLDWCAIATMSSRSPIKDMPFANIFSFSDGLSEAESTGIPYLYLNRDEMSVQDIIVNSNVSMTLSLAQTPYCKENGYDAQDPRCSHIILTGQIIRLDKGSAEEAFAKNTLWTKHDEMHLWPQNHDWLFVRLEIVSVIVLDYFGGAQHVPLKEYFQATPY